MRRRTLINNKEQPKARLIQHVDTMLGDFVFYDSSSDSMLYYRFDDGGEDIIPDTCTPIGAVAIPYELSEYFDKACGVVALENLGYTVWGNTNSFITENITTKPYAGKEKTQAIIEHRGAKPDGWTPDIDNPDDFPAASLCNLYSTIGTNQGDWYLPSSDEFMACSVVYNIFFDYKSEEFIKYYGDYEISSIPWSCDEENSSDAISLGMSYYGYSWGMFQTPKTSYRDVNPFIQIGGMKVNYGDIVISGGTVNDIPASGGSQQVSSYTYSQTYGYGDSYTDGGTITSGADVSVTSVSGGDLVDNETERVKKGDSVLTVTMNGKTVTKSYPVYQEANVATYGDIVVKNSGSAPVIPASGGSSTASGVVCEQTVSYTSNYSKKTKISYGNYTTVSVNSLGTTEKAQSVVGNSVVVVTGGGGKKIEVKVPVYQQENKANVTSEITAYGTPTVSIGSGITCAGGSATVSHSVTNTRTYYYTSNAPGKTENVAGTTTIKITSNGNSRFSLSGNKLSHSTMGKNEVTDSCTITATNSGDTSKTKTATVSVTNTSSTTYGAPTAGTITNGYIAASGGSASASAGNGSQAWTKTYCTGQKDTGTISVSPSIASISGSASSKGETTSGQTTVKSQSVTWSANGKSTSGMMYVYQRANSFSGVTFTTSVSSASISAAGGNITVSGTAKVNWSSGSYSKTPSYRISDQNAGATISGSTIKFPKNTATTTKYAYAQTYLVYNGTTYYDNSGAKKITQDRQLPTNTITAYTPYGGSTTVSVYASSAVGSDLQITVTCHCEDMMGSGSMVTASGSGVMRTGTSSLTVTIERAVTMGYEVTEITNVNVSPLIDNTFQYVTVIA